VHTRMARGCCQQVHSTKSEGSTLTAGSDMYGSHSISGEPSVLNLPVFILTLVPLFSGTVPGGSPTAADLPTLLGVHGPISREFITGNWRSLDHFVRWGITDKKKARVREFDPPALMSVREDGTIRMLGFFQPEEGRWEVSRDGILIFDPRRLEQGSQIFPVRKRDQDRIWVILPFSGGATGIGMVRISDEEFEKVAESFTGKQKKRRERTSRR